MSQPPTQRHSLSLTVVQFEYIFAIGGENCHNDYLQSVDIYNIENNFWMGAPALNHARKYHSSCSLGHFVYTCCGKGISGEDLNSFERIDAIAYLNGESDVEWE